MKNACPSCGTKLSHFRHGLPHFDCPKCKTPLKSNSTVLQLISIGAAVSVYLTLVALLPSGATSGAIYLLLVAKLAIVLSIYAALGRCYYTVTLDQDSG